MTETQRDKSIARLLSQLESPHLKDAEIKRIKEKLEILQQQGKQEQRT